MELENRLASLVEGEGITFSRALAVDPGSLTVVTLAVPGDSYGKVWRHLIPGARRAAALETLRLVGRAARLIEDCSVDPIPVDQTSQRAAIDRRLQRVREVLSGPTLQGIEALMVDLTEEMSLSDRAMVYCHGDLSGSNVLVDGRRVGIIDFTWPLRQRGFDLAHFAFRIEYDSPVTASLTSPLRDALLSGYGDPAATEQPGYKFVRLSKLLKVVEETGPRAMTRRGRARAEIESYL
jgi:aminoglycoside phosphotransferase